MSIQAFGPNFNLKDFLYARDTARALCLELSSLVQVGMSEEDLHQLYKKLMTKYQIEKNWHPPKLRIGVNTTKSFKDPSLPTTLQEDDLYFIDIGPIIKNHEADYGEPFALGNHFEYKRLAHKSQELWHLVAEKWRKDQLTGVALYEYAQNEANKMGYTLNLNEKGHRLSDFPHHLIHKGGLRECEEVPVPHAWILEIHLIHPELSRGAFYEDILV